MFKFRKEERIMLPTTPEEFDAIVDKAVDKYGFKNRNHTGSLISVAIRHLPNDQDWTTMEYLASTIRKNIANQLANWKGQKFGHMNQVSALADILEKDPNNQQAIDELTKYAGQGSESAKAVLSKFEEDRPEGLHIVGQASDKAVNEPIQPQA